MRSALLAADLVLIPVQPSPLDGWASAEMLALIAEARIYRPELVARFVLNRCGARTVLARETAETLADHDPPVLAATIGQRIAFAAAAQSGRLVSELDDDTRRARDRGAGGAIERSASGERRDERASDPSRLRLPARRSRTLDQGGRPAAARCRRRRLHRPAHHRRDAELRGRIKIAAFGAASPSPTCCALLAREFPRPRRRTIMTGAAASRARRPMPPRSRRQPHPCRADACREADRELDQVRPRGARTGARPPPPRLLLSARQRLRLRPLGGQRLRHDHLAHRHRARRRAGEAYQTLPFVRPGGDILLKIEGWPKVEQVLRHIDAVEAPASTPATSRPITGGMSATGSAPAMSRAPTPWSAIRPGSSGGRSSNDPLRLCHDDVFGDDGRRHRRHRSDAPRLVWNASASAPIGLYDLDPPRPLASAIWSPSCRTSRSPTSWSGAAISAAACR
jgi:hypothetical protein